MATIDIFLNSRFNSQGVTQAIQGLSSVEGSMKILEDAAEQIGAEAMEMTRNLSPKELTSQMQESADATRLSAKAFDEMADSALAVGKTGLAAGLREQAQGMRDTADASQGLGQQFKKTGGIIDWLVNNPLNQFGFALFITQNTIKSLIGLMRGLIDSIGEGAAAGDKMRAFGQMMEGIGAGAGTMQSKMEAASQGVVSMDTVYGKSIQLMKAGLPDIAAQSDKILEIAVASASLTGELDKVDEIYQKLIRGIVRGSPKLIDDADILLKLGDANEKYAASLGKTVDQLTVVEQKQATAAAVLEGGAPILEMAEQLESSSMKVAKLTTALDEGSLAVKQFFAEILVSKKESPTWEENFKTFASSIGATGEKLKFVTSLFKDFKTSVKTMLAGAAAGIKAFVFFASEIVKTSLAIIPALGTVGRAFEFVYHSAAGNLPKALDALAAFQKGVEVTRDWAGINIGGIGDVVNTTMTDILTGLGVLDSEVKGLDFSNLGTGVDEAAETVSDAMNKILELERDFRIKRLDASTEHKDQMADAWRDYNDKLADLATDLNRKLADLWDERLEKETDSALNLSRKLSDIDTDLADKMSDITGDSNDKRADAREQAARNMENIEEDHQRAINKIQRKFEMSRLKAIIDRDARALFEANAKHREELKDLEDTTDKKQEDELKKLEETLKKIDKLEASRRADAIKAADRRRQDAIKAQERQLDDIKKDYERRRTDAQRENQRARDEAREHYDEALRDENTAQRRRLRDANIWYQRQLEDLRRSQNDQLAVLNQGLVNQQVAIANHMNTIDGMYRGGGTSLPPTTGGDPGVETRGPGDPPLDPEDPCPSASTIRVGNSCNVVRRSHPCIGADGQQYLCLYNVWRLATDLNDGGYGYSTASSGESPVAMTGTSTSIASGGTASGFSSVGSNNRVTINVTGDQTLEAIFKGIAYEAFIEVVE